MPVTARLQNGSRARDSTGLSHWILRLRAPKLGHPLGSDEEFAMLLLRGHSYLLGADLADVRSYVFASLRLQDNPQFAQGQAAGGNDCNDLLTGASTRTLTLMGYLIEG